MDKFQGTDDMEKIKLTERQKNLITERMEKEVSRDDQMISDALRWSQTQMVSRASEAEEFWKLLSYEQKALIYWAIRHPCTCQNGNPEGMDTTTTRQCPIHGM